MKLNRFFLLIALIFAFNAAPVFSFDFKKTDIKITGNKAISADTILSIISSQKNNFNTADLNLFQKKIFETNFFSSVEVKLSGDKILIHVFENPLIDYLIVQGLEKRNDYKTIIDKNLSLKANSIFSESLLNKDVKFINSFLSSEGYYQNNVEYKINKIDNNKVNVFFEIKLNNKFLVKNIYFLGDKKFSTSTLKDVISASEDSWFSLFSKASVPSSNRIAYDTSSLKRFYLRRGYYEAQIVNATIDLVNNQYANVVFVINAGDRFTFEKVFLTNESASLKENDIVYIDNVIKGLKGKYYDQDLLRKSFQKVVDYLESYNISVEVDYFLNKIAVNKLSLNFSLKEIKEKKFINNIVVSGNDITDEKVIRNNLFFSEGDSVSRLSISKSKDALNSLGIFGKVNIREEKISNSTNINLSVEVEEMPTGEIAAGAGYGSSGASINFSLQEKNFLGQGLSTNVSVNLGTEKVLGSISFSNPDFSNTGNTLSNSIFVSKYTYDNAGYENKVIGDNISISYEAFENINLELGFSGDFDSINSKTANSQVLRNRHGNYLTTKFYYNINNDQRNRKFKPSAGYTFGFGQDLASLISDVPYFSNRIFGTFYNEFAEDYVGSIRYKVSSINAIGESDIKLSDRLFLRDNDLRGFGYRSVGPKIDDLYIGGNYAYASTFSTTVPNGLPDKWAAETSLFFDVGNVWGSDFQGPSSSNTVRSSVGLGFSWRSPIGPLSFTYAEAITKNSTDTLDNFNFKLGGTF